MNDLARKMLNAAAMSIPSSDPARDAKHAVTAALYEITQEYHGTESVPLSDLRRLLTEIGAVR